MLLIRSLSRACSPRDETIGRRGAASGSPTHGGGPKPRPAWTVWRRWAPSPLVAVALALPLLLVACGSDPAASGSASPSSSMTQEEAILAMAECLRDEGFDVDDPTFDEEGNPQFGMGGGGGLGDVDPQELQTALDECQERTGASFGNFVPDPDERAELEDMLLEFAECMREQGIDFPDPDLSGHGGAGFFGNIDRSDPDIQAAFEVCQDLLGDLPGPGGGG